MLKKQIYFLTGMLMGVIMMIVVGGCASKPIQPKEYVIKIESEIPVNVSVYKPCDGNWNFCKWQ